ncbi:hypothetical protein [Nocardioides caricicola]|uniref:Uncharacterized protein n=1 Tax=Nocardioides caricicola TaxID=634770 RepID=A0ABW0MZ24_9ACTN
MTQSSTEFEDELEMEHEYEDEAFLGGLAKIAGGLLGEEEYEFEDEYEGELEDEYEMELESEYEFEDEYEGEFEDEFEMELESEFESEGEYEAEDEYEGEYELEDEYEGEYEDELESEEEFFFKKIGRAMRKVPFRKILKVAGPLVATAVGGPAAGMLAKAVASQLEGEFEDELESELEEMATAPVTSSQAEAEYLAARAATTESESEAESFVGSAVAMTISPRDRAELERLLPNLLRGASVLTKILHRNPATRPGVRMVPGIVGSTASTLAQMQASGRRITPAEVGAVMAGSTQRVLGDPRWQRAVTRRHARGLAHVHRRRHHGGRRPRGYRPGPRRTGRPAYRRTTTVRRGPVTVRRRPTQVRTVRSRAKVGRPRPGVVRVVTPVRIPAKGGRPARTVKVVSDVKVPRGAVPSGRPIPVTAKKRR